MLLYLVQHAEAKRETEDPARPLSERGRQDISKVAQRAAAAKVAVRHIFHSPKLRAKETAEILASYLNPPGGMEESTGLTPMDDPQIWAERLKEMGENAMLVGHLPHMARLASLLIAGDSEMKTVAFRMGGMVCLQRSDEERNWMIRWILIPEIAL